MAAIGVLASLTMDVAGLIAGSLGLAGQGPGRTGADLIGRWFGYLLKGELRHHTILDTPPLRYEVALGLAVHYSIGVTLALIYFGFMQLTATAVTSLSLVIYGIATTVFPWFLLYPSWGYGWLGTRAPGDAHLIRMSVVNHVFFGLGLALWAYFLLGGISW
jgi:phage shock protein PspC (stress-responsive transcriptional regulator)